MSEVLQTNIFFFITGIAVIIFTLLLCILLYHVIKITKSIRRIMDRIEAGSEIIAEDMSHFRRYFTEGSLISSLLGVFLGVRRGGSSSSAAKTSKKSTKKKATKGVLQIKDED